MLIIRRSKLYYTASGIVTHVGGRPVHRLREDLCTGRPPTECEDARCCIIQFLFCNKFIVCLSMFRALLCSSSGFKNCIIQHLVSSHSVGGRPAHTCTPDDKIMH